MGEEMNGCTRCGLPKSHTFFIQPKVPGFALPPELAHPPEPIVASCIECMSNDEISGILFPVALFVIQTLLEGRFSHMRGLGESQHFGYVATWLRLNCGVEVNERNKALAALRGMAG
jgi:hypothetical protein